MTSLPLPPTHTTYTTITINYYTSLHPRVRSLRIKQIVEQSVMPAMYVPSIKPTTYKTSSSLLASTLE